jgi:hypothetical protein
MFTGRVWVDVNVSVRPRATVWLGLVLLLGSGIELWLW